jgi:hypothetical protein
MGYEIKLQGSNLRAVEYHAPGSFTKRSSNGMKRWSSRQAEFDKHPIEVSGISFVQWLKLLKRKRLVVDTL